MYSVISLSIAHQPQTRTRTELIGYGGVFAFNLGD
jgi:hypothetical protein